MYVRRMLSGDAMNLDLLRVLDAREIKVFNQCLAKLATWRPKEEDGLSTDQEVD